MRDDRFRGVLIYTSSVSFPNSDENSARLSSIHPPSVGTSNPLPKFDLAQNFHKFNPVELFYVN